MKKEKPSTKQRIMFEALNLFAERGYKPVTVIQIADAVGIKAPSLYKHYKSKRAIFEAILTEMDVSYAKQTASMRFGGLDADADKAFFLSITEEQLIEKGKELFLYFLHDDYASKFRKMLSALRHGDKELADQFSKWYIDNPLSYQELLFAMLANAGVLLQENTQVMALHFYAPFFMLMSLCDCYPEREAEVLDLLERHIRQFNRMYTVQGGFNG